MRNWCPPIDIRRPGSDHTRLSGWAFVTLAVGHDHDVALAVRDDVPGVGVGRQQVAGMKRRVGHRGRIGAGAQELTEILAVRRLADLIDGQAVAAAVYLERHLAALADGSPLRASGDAAGRNTDRWDHRCQWFGGTAAGRAGPSAARRSRRRHRLDPAAPIHSPAARRRLPTPRDVRESGFHAFSSAITVDGRQREQEEGMVCRYGWSA